MRAKIHIEEIAIELTRKCNMRCYHCLRGDAENLDMDLSFVESLFKKVKSFNTITLTGGEPSLVPDIIQKIADLAQKQNVKIGHFYLATNGKKITMEFIHALLRLYTEWISYDEECIPVVQWSNDGYHDPYEKDEKGLRLLQALKFVSPKYEKDGETFSCLDEGRASLFAPCDRTPRVYEIEVEKEYDEYYIRGETLYLSCKGWILAGCNWSYEHQDDPDHECRICHVNKLSITEIKKYNKKMEFVEI